MSEGKDLGSQVALGLKAAERDVEKAQVAFRQAFKEMEEAATRRPPWWQRLLMWGRW